MTKAQEKAVEKLRKMGKELFWGDESDYEYKRFEINENEYFVSLVMEVGRKGDEGTLGAIYARDRCHLFIGKRGGITYPCKNKAGEYITRRFKGYSILQAVCDQQ